MPDPLPRTDTMDELYPRLADADLLRRAVEHPFGWRSSQPRWSAVGSVFSLGSTSSAALCRRFGLNPDQTRKEAAYADR